MAEDSSEVKKEVAPDAPTEALTEVPEEAEYSSRLNWKIAVPTAIAAFILLVVSLLPLVVEYSAENWLREHGVPQAEIDNVDLNLFAGELKLQGLKAGDGLNISRLSLNIDWLPLFKQIVHVRSLRIQTANLHLHQDAQQQWQLAEITLPTTDAQQAEQSESQPEDEPQSEPWLAVVDDLQISELLLDVNGQEMQLKLPVETLRLNLSGLQNSEQKLSADLKLGETDFSGFGYQVNNQSLQLAANLLFSMAAEDIVASLKSEDTGLKLAGLKLAQQDGQALAAVESMDLNDLQISGPNRHKLASLHLGNVSLQPKLTGAGSLKLAAIDVQKIDADLLGEVGFSSLILKQLQADAMSGGDDRMRLQRLELVDFTTQPGKTLNLKSLAMQNFDLKQKQGKQLLGAIERVNLNNVAMTGTDKGVFDSLTLSGIKLPASGKRSLGSIGAIVASGATLDTSGIYQLKKLEFNNLDTTLIKQKNGKFVVLDELGAEKLETPAKVKVAAKGEGEPEAIKTAVKEKSAKEKMAKDPVVVINELIISPGSKIAYRDESLSPVLDTRMIVKKFRFAPLDLSGNRDGELDMQMAVGKYGELSAKGKLRPHARKLKSDILLTLKHFEMPGLSGFIEPDFGKSIKTGQFNVDASINISDNKISAKNKLLIRKLELGDSDQPGKAEASIGMPVGMALDMLRNDRGDIEMEVPITGDLDDPNINLNAIINKALMSSLSAGAMTYATLALQPYGSIILAADLASDLIKQAAKPKLTPIIFEELATTLNPQMQDYISKIAILLKKSEEFRVQVCGVATRIEGESIAQPPVDGSDGKPAGAVEVEPAQSDEVLLALAEKRADIVMDALKAHGITTERLFGCKARIDEAKLKAKSRVDLLLD